MYIYISSLTCHGHNGPTGPGAENARYFIIIMEFCPEGDLKEFFRVFCFADPLACSQPEIHR